MRRYKKIEFKNIKQGFTDEYIIEPSEVNSISGSNNLDLSSNNKPVITPSQTYSSAPALIAGYPRILLPKGTKWQILMSGSSVKICRRASASVGFSALSDAPGYLDCLFQDKIFLWKYITDAKTERYVSSDFGTSFSALPDFPVGPDGNVIDYAYFNNGNPPVKHNKKNYVFAQYFEDETYLIVSETVDYITINHLFDLQVDKAFLKAFSMNGELYAWLGDFVSGELQLIRINLETEDFEEVYSYRTYGLGSAAWYDLFEFNGYQCVIVKDAQDTLWLLTFDGIFMTPYKFMAGQMLDYIHFMGVINNRAYFCDYSLTGAIRYHFFSADFFLFPNFFSVDYANYSLPHDLTEFDGIPFYAMNHKSGGAADATYCLRIPIASDVVATCTVDYPIISAGRLQPKQIIVRHDPLTTSQKVEIYYKCDKATSWTKLGESATVGAVAARLTFSDNLPCDFIQFQVKLTRSSANLSPTDVNFDFLYLPLGLENAG